MLCDFVITEMQGMFRYQCKNPSCRKKAVWLPKKLQLQSVCGISQTPACRNLGIPVEREGVAVKVKCGCSGKLKDQYHVTYRCGEHRRALPTLRLNATQRTEWEDREESKIYHACDGCKEYEPCLT